jgi:[ribosomal protein S5]-alanine N-acetyltransferase
MKLETNRLLLRPYEEQDLAAALAILGDPQTMNFYAQPYTEEQVTKIIRNSIESLRTYGYGTLAVIEKSSGALIGDCGITIQNIDGQNEYEVGYRIHRSKWGQGYAYQAAAAVLNHGFDALGLQKLCSYMASDHLQSRRVAEKLGMTVEKMYRNPRNRGYLTCVYSLHRDAQGKDNKGAIGNRQ